MQRSNKSGLRYNHNKDYLPTYHKKSRYSTPVQREHDFRLKNMLLLYFLKPLTTGL